MMVKREKDLISGKVEKFSWMESLHSNQASVIQSHVSYLKADISAEFMLQITFAAI